LKEAVPDEALPVRAGQLTGPDGNDVLSLERMKGCQRFGQLF
jgi:hypothetical protein